MHVTQEAAERTFRHPWPGLNQIVTMQSDAEEIKCKVTETTCIPDGSWEGLPHFGSHELEPLCCFVHTLCFKGAFDVHTAGRPETLSTARVSYMAPCMDVLPLQ